MNLTARPRWNASPREMVNSFESYDPDRPDQRAARFFREYTDLTLPGYVPTDNESVWEYYVDLAVGHVRSGRDFVFVITGDPGEGKSTLAEWFCSRVGNALKIELNLKESAFDTKRGVVRRLSILLFRLYEATGKAPVVIQADEGCMVGADARAGGSPEGILLNQALSVCRIKRAVLAVLHPAIEGLASPIRHRRGRYWVHVESPIGGSLERTGEATVFRARTALPSEVLKKLPFSKMPRPFHRLKFDSLDGDPMWEDYNADKLEDTNQFLLDLALRAVALEFQRGLRVPEWAIPYLNERAPVWWTSERARSGEEARSSIFTTRPCRWGCGRVGEGFALAQHEAFCEKQTREGGTPPSPPGGGPPTRPCKWGCGLSAIEYNVAQHEAACPKRPKTR